MAPRRHDGSGRTITGWVALALALLWIALMALVLSVANTAKATDLAGAGVTGHPFDDPPIMVAQAEFLVGLVGITALPTALVVIALGYRAVVRGWVAGHRVGWVALVIGGVSLLPALVACLFGVLICVLDGGVVAGG